MCCFFILRCFPQGFHPWVTDFHRDVDIVYVRHKPPLLPFFGNKAQPSRIVFQSPVWSQRLPGAPATSCHPLCPGGQAWDSPPQFCLLPLLLLPGQPFLFKNPPETYCPVKELLVVPSSPSSEPKCLKEAGLGGVSPSPQRPFPWLAQTTKSPAFPQGALPPASS